MTPLKSIVDSGLVQLPLHLKCLSHNVRAKATLAENGTIEFQESIFPDVDTAMKIALSQHNNALLQSSSSSGWQFWGWFDTSRSAWTPLEHLRARSAALDKKSIRTSDTHPLRIDPLTVAGYPGKLGLTFCPGKHSNGIYGGQWQRNLTADLKVVKNWRPRYLISLIEDYEFELLNVGSFRHRAYEADLDWLHLPIADMSIPDAQFEQRWLKLRDEIHQELANGSNIVIHCRGGLGRTGTLAARILVEAGIEPANAVKQVRAAREHSIETFEQEEYILQQQWIDKPD